MKLIQRQALAAALAAGLAVSAPFAAFAQEDTPAAPGETPGGMMQGNGMMMGGDMGGMTPMMQACAEMMQVMTDHMKSHDHSTDGG